MLLPRLAQNIARPRISAWFARHARTPLRLLIAPAGCGKTSALVAYLRNSTLPFAFINATPQTTLRDLGAEVTAAFGLPGAKSDAPLQHILAGAGRAEIAIDNIDVLAGDVRDALQRLAEAGPENVSLIFTSHTWDAIDVERLAPQGLAAVCDARTLAFEATEIGALCDLLETPCMPDDAQRLVEETDGWAIVAAGAVRAAAEGGRSLSNGYERWAQSEMYLFRQFVASAVNQLPGAEVERWERLLSEGAADDQSELRDLERQGFFVVHDDRERHHVYRVIENALGAQTAFANLAPVELPPLIVRVLGEFRTTIGDQHVKWIRRRDQHVFMYLVLKDDGCASRAELCQRFWPEVEPDLRAASLRVVCSNIRRAIGQLVGHARIERYFRSDGDIAVNFANVSLDARRFRLHILDGDEQYQLGNIQEALAHYRTAEALYAGRVGWGANASDWIDRIASLYETLYLGALGRLVALYGEIGDSARAVEYAQKASLVKTRAKRASEPVSPQAC